MQFHYRTVVAVAGTGALALALGAATIRSAHGATHARIDTTTEQSVKGAVITAINDSTLRAAAFGIQGIVTAGTGNVGVAGYGASKAVSGIGVYGSGLGSNSTGVYGRASSTATGQNSTGVIGQSASGNGILGTSTAFDGVVGETKFVGTAARSTGGILGLDQGGAIYNFGVQGQSAAGAGVVGVATSGYGLFGASNPSADPQANDVGDGAYASSTNGDGQYAFSTNRLGGAFESTTSTFATLAAIADTAGSPPFVAVNNATGASLIFDDSGNLTISGTLTYTPSAGGNPVTLARRRTALASTSRPSATFGAQASRPELEDVGEAHAVNGVAAVAIDAALAGAIDATPYSVFITPEADTNGVYVTQKTSRGFIVREARGGRSSFDFAYRIVAHPAGSPSARLPQITATDMRRLGVSSRSVRSAAFVRNLSATSPAAVLPKTLP